MRMMFADLHSDDLWALRQEIVLNSIFVSDYKNSFGFAPKSMQVFFDGYLEYLCDLAEEDGVDREDISEVIANYDDESNLFDYYWNSADEQDGYEWVEYTPEWTEEELQEYEDYWNGVEDEEDEEDE